MTKAQREGDLSPSFTKVAVADLIPYARNARTHSDEQVAKIAASIREFGFLNPIITDGRNGIIAGHGRVLAAQKLGLDVLPAIEASHLTDAQRRAYILADNRLALDAGWDEDMLKIELADLDADGFDLDLTGFDMGEIGKLMAEPAQEGESDPDEAPEPPVTPASRPGDLWVLGQHRVLCGDSTDPAAVERLMAGERADMLFTSPPYAQQRDYGVAKEKVTHWDALMQGVFAAAPVKEGAQILVNLGLVHRNNEWLPYWEKWIAWMRESGWRSFGWYVWDQGPGLPGDWNGRLAPSHEFIFHFNRQPRKPNKAVESKHAGKVLGGGGLRGADGSIKRKTGAGQSIQTHRIPDSVFRVMRHKGGLGEAGNHPAVFPVALVEEALAAYSKEGDVLYEPFCGSGTQVVAAEKMGRHCFGIDIDPAYVDVAVRRWQIFTGKAATLDGDGRSFEAIAAERLAQEGKPDAAA